MFPSVIVALYLLMCRLAKQMLCVQDPTCLCGSEASINQKLLGERTLLEEGSIVVLEQVS